MKRARLAIAVAAVAVVPLLGGCGVKVGDCNFDATPPKINAGGLIEGTVSYDCSPVPEGLSILVYLERAPRRGSFYTRLGTSGALSIPESGGTVVATAPFSPGKWRTKAIVTVIGNTQVPEDAHLASLPVRLIHP